MNADARRLKGAAKQAGRAMSLLDKELCLRLAGEWIKLAQDAEQRRGRQ